MTDRYAHVLAVVFSHPWAIEAETLSTVADILARRIAGQDPVRADIEAALVKRDRLPQPVSGGGVGIIPVHGVIMPRGDMLAESSGAVSLDALSGQLRDALANTAVKSILLDVDSPGGNVAGLTEFTHEVMRARTKKPVIAHARYTMASAAYGLASAATEIVASPSSSIGSIGVMNIHDDMSAALEKLGIKRTYITAGKYKAAGNETEPLTAEHEALLKARVDEAYGMLVADISRGRGVPISAIRAGYGEGRTVSAQEALSLGMVDRIATLEDTLARLMVSPPQAGARAATQLDAPLDTAQEPVTVTAQDRADDAHWQNAATRALLELDL